MAVDFVDAPAAVANTQDVLLYCGLERPELLVSDRHRIVLASRGAQQPVEDPRTGRRVVALSSGALAGTMGLAFSLVPGIC